MEPIRVGIAGAGPWARMVHAPTFAAGPGTLVAGVWSRTAASADALAAAHGVAAFRAFDDLLAACDAVVLAVPPSVQPELAARAAAAGRTLLLEKPLADTVEGAERVVAAIDDAGVGSLMVLTYRFSQAVRTFLDASAGFTALGGRGAFLSGALLGETWGRGWRTESGVLLDVGPHILDLADAALGPIVAVQAHGDPASWVGLLVTHDTGAVSEISISCRCAITPSRTELELFGPEGTLAVDGRIDGRDQIFATMRSELVAIAREGPGHPCDAHRGLHLQRVIHAASVALRDGGSISVR